MEIKKYLYQIAKLNYFLRLLYFPYFSYLFYLSIINKNFYKIDFLSVSFNVVSVLTEPDMSLKTTVVGVISHYFSF